MPGPDDALASPPEPLNAEHDVSNFSSARHPSLDDWLRHRALESEGLSARTYVVCAAAEPRRVIGYYAIAAARESRAALPSARLRRAMPEQVPLLLIARLAVDSRFAGQGIGRDLVADAIRRCVAASGIVGARAIVASAIDDEAAGFYLRCGFLRSPLGERMMVLPLETARAAAGISGQSAPR